VSAELPHAVSAVVLPVKQGSEIFKLPYGLESLLARYRDLLGEAVGVDTSEVHMDDPGNEGGGESRAPSSERAQAVGSVCSRADVRRALDAICHYYEENDPSSPVPLLLKRARRLVDMKFAQIIQDLAPGAMNEINQIIGVDNTEGMQ
jgi:type VI secretion system protein ImpA